MPRKSPCSSTPLMLLIWAAVRSGSGSPPSKVRSRIRFPLSVLKGSRSPPRSSRRSARASSRSPVPRPAAEEGKPLDRHVGLTQARHQLRIVGDDQESTRRQCHQLLPEERAAVPFDQV